MYANISPHLFVLTNLVVALLSFSVFRQTGHHYRYFFGPVFALAVIYALFNILRQYRGQSCFSVEKKLDIVRLLKRSLARYLVWLGVLYAATGVFEAHAFYFRTGASLAFFSWFVKLYLIFGLPYFLLTLTLKSSVTEDFYDPAIRLIHIFKQLTLGLARGRFGSAFAVLKKRYNRKVLLNLVMKAYFIPVMAGQVYYNLNNAIRFSSFNFGNYDFFTICLWITAILWLMDTTNATLSYCLESRWIENRSRSIDMTLGGWMVCLMCYAPLNGITGAVFQFAPFAGMRHPESIISQDITFLYVIKLIEIAVLVVHIYADVSLGPSVANITLKKLQTRGLYGVIRHPGTNSKLLLWWIQAVFYAEFWKGGYLLGHLGWNGIYILRALTEERHLSRHEEYMEYRKNVRYRFLPGII